MDIKRNGIEKYVHLGPIVAFSGSKTALLVWRTLSCRDIYEMSRFEQFFRLIEWETSLTRGQIEVSTFNKAFISQKEFAGFR